MRGSYIRAIAGRLFLGTFRKRVNSKMSPYITGHRQTFSILDITNSASRLQKFLLFLKLTVKNKSMLFCVLSPSVLSLAPAISGSSQSFSSKWIGGVLTNYAYCCFFFIRSKLYASYYMPRLFPGASIFYNNSKQSVNESIKSRTPGAFLADSSCNVYHTVYGIVGNTSFNSFKLLADLSLSACRQGLRAQRITLARTLYFSFLKNVPKSIYRENLTPSFSHLSKLWPYYVNSVVKKLSLETLSVIFANKTEKRKNSIQIRNTQFKNLNNSKKKLNYLQFFKTIIYVKPVFNQLLFPFNKSLLDEMKIFKKYYDK